MKEKLKNIITLAIAGVVTNVIYYGKKQNPLITAKLTAISAFYE